jgi:pSer/pThr/pTyr-binding forkhead associated (FHA) protein
MFKLVIQDDEGKTTVVPLIRDEITIGRKEGNTIRLTERNVSRRHARILRNNGEVHIEDLGSYNGIRVNNARIAERVSLRVSDQVQIGDYKLYLKAEEPSRAAATTTSAPSRSSAINAWRPPIPQMPEGGTRPPSSRQLDRRAERRRCVHRPAAFSSTDPRAGAGRRRRPGRVAILSTNFAGQEYELVAAMVIGRTDDNDIVVNHRSISRHHAKVVREHGRYAIVDLQSSNGVRVNGEEYGKVELRRGDLVDLGHVRSDSSARRGLRVRPRRRGYGHRRPAGRGCCHPGRRGLIAGIAVIALVAGGEDRRWRRRIPTGGHRAAATGALAGTAVDAGTAVIPRRPPRRRGQGAGSSAAVSGRELDLARKLAEAAAEEAPTRTRPTGSSRRPPRGSNKRSATGAEAAAAKDLKTNQWFDQITNSVYYEQARTLYDRWSTTMQEIAESARRRQVQDGLLLPHLAEAATRSTGRLRHRCGRDPPRTPGNPPQDRSRPGSTPPPTAPTTARTRDPL